MPPAPKPLLSALGAFLVRRRGPVLAAAGVLLLLLTLPVFGLRVGYSISGFFDSSDPQLHDAVAHYGEFEIPDNLLLFCWPEADPFGDEALQRLARFRAAATALPGVRRVISLENAEIPGRPGASRRAVAESHTWRRLLVGRQHDALGGIVLFDRSMAPEARNGQFAVLYDWADREGVALRLAGIPYHRAQVVAMVHGDIVRFLPLATAVSAVFLFWMVPHAGLALLALLVVPCTLLATLGTMALAGTGITMLTSTLPTLLMCMAVADGVHLVGRFLEQRRAGAEPRAAAEAAFAHTFLPCLLTSLTTAAGFLSLSFAELPDLRDLGVFAAIGVGYAFLFTMAVMPPVLSMVAGRGGYRPPDPAAGLVALARQANRLSPRRLLLPAGVLLAIAVVLALRVPRDHRMTGDLWPDSPVMQQLDFYQSHFVGIMPGEVMVRAENGFDAAERHELEFLARSLDRFADVDRTLSLVDLLADRMPLAAARAAAALGVLPAGILSRDGKRARVLLFQSDLGTAAYEDFLARLAVLCGKLRRLRAAPAGLQVVGTAQVNRLVGDLSRSFAGSLLVILLLVWLWLRSLRLGLIAMVPSLLPLVGNLAIMTLSGMSLRPLTIITFCVAFGLAVDDTVHLLARYREERASGLDPGDAMDRTLATAGRPVVVTTILLLVGFATILTSNFKGTFSFGLLVLLALCGSLLGALVLLPALLRALPAGGPRAGPAPR